MLSKTVCTLLLTFAATNALAHHSFAPHFDASKKLNISGTVTEYEARNPHSYLHVNAVDENGRTREYVCESHGVTQLSRIGITPQLLKAGTKVRVTGSLSRHSPYMRLLKGRGLEESDAAKATPVTVINETMAKTFFKGEDPIGKHILISQLVLGKRARGPDIPWEVVGVVKDEKVAGRVFSGLGQDMPVIYVTFYQNPGTRNSLVVRATNPMLLIRLIEQAIWKVNTDQAVENVETLEEIKSQSIAPARTRTVLLTIFAGIAVLLTAVGIYGVVSYSVAQRAREMAIRLTLGASPGDLLKLVIGKAMLMSTSTRSLVKLSINDASNNCGFSNR